MSQPECPVCMVAFDRDSRNTVTTECGHQFHYTCLFKWNQDNSNCPMCRHDFEDIEKAPEPPSSGQHLPELSMTGDFIESAREFGMRINCQECNEKVEECSTGCGRITCYWGHRLVSSSPIGVQFSNRTQNFPLVLNVGGIGIKLFTTISNSK